LFEITGEFKTSVFDISGVLNIILYSKYGRDQTLGSTQVIRGIRHIRVRDTEIYLYIKLIAVLTTFETLLSLTRNMKLDSISCLAYLSFIITKKITRQIMCCCSNYLETHHEMVITLETSVLFYRFRISL
jgi:hypothetical protein